MVYHSSPNRGRQGVSRSCCTTRRYENQEELLLLRFYCSAVLLSHHSAAAGSTSRHKAPPPLSLSKPHLGREQPTKQGNWSLRVAVSSFSSVVSTFVHSIPLNVYACVVVALSGARRRRFPPFLFLLLFLPSYERRNSHKER